MTKLCCLVKAFVKCLYCGKRWCYECYFDKQEHARTEGCKDLPIVWHPDLLIGNRKRRHIIVKAII